MRKICKQTQGYVLISTLFFLMLSGLFSHTMIQISSNYLLQLKQLSTAYEVKAALSMGESLLRDELENEELPESGSIHTSAGKVSIQGVTQPDQIVYELTLTRGNGDRYHEEVVWPMPQIVE